MISYILLLTALLLPRPDGDDDPRRHFRAAGLTGSFLLCAIDGDSCLRVDPRRCAQRFTPASTFKILNSLIALEYGAVAGLDDTLRWDGTQHVIASWNQDQCMRDAFQRSCVWFYQELARRIGDPRMRAAVQAVSYGNQDIDGGIDRFWLDGALRISPDEQAEFLTKLWKNALPFSPDVQQTVKDLMLLERNEEYTLRGKTGTELRGATVIGWIVGYLERGGTTYVYVLNVEHSDAADLGEMREKRFELLRELLRAQQLL